MNESEAIKAMKKLWGKKAAWRVDNKALTGEKREEMNAVVTKLKEAQNAAEDAVKARRAELLQDPEYQRLKESAQIARDKTATARGKAYRRRITIGCVDMGFFNVKAEGDNWAEAIAKARGTDA